MTEVRHIGVNVNTNSSRCRFLQNIIQYRLMTGRFLFPPFCRTFGVKYLPNLARKAFKLALKYEELLRWGQTHHCTARQDHSVTFNQSFSSNSWNINYAFWENLDFILSKPQPNHTGVIEWLQEGYGNWFQMLLGCIFFQGRSSRWNNT